METVKCNGNRFIHTTVSVNIHKPLPPEKKKKLTFCLICRFYNITYLLKLANTAQITSFVDPFIDSISKSMSDNSRNLLVANS